MLSTLTTKTVYMTKYLSYAFHLSLYWSVAGVCQNLDGNLWGGWTGFKKLVHFQYKSTHMHLLLGVCVETIDPQVSKQNLAFPSLSFLFPPPPPFFLETNTSVQMWDWTSIKQCPSIPFSPVSVILCWSAEWSPLLFHSGLQSGQRWSGWVAISWSHAPRQTNTGFVSMVILRKSPDLGTFFEFVCMSSWREFGAWECAVYMTSKTCTAISQTVAVSFLTKD